MAQKKRRRRPRKVCLIGAPTTVFSFRGGRESAKVRKQWGIPVPTMDFGIGGR